MGKEILKVVALMTVVLLGACATTGGGNFCKTAGSPMRITEHDVDVISDGLADDLLAYHEKGAKFCGWKP